MFEIDAGLWELILKKSGGINAFNLFFYDKKCINAKIYSYSQNIINIQKTHTNTQ